jgi:hypothetical protein
VAVYGYRMKKKSQNVKPLKSTKYLQLAVGLRKIVSSCLGIPTVRVSGYQVKIVAGHDGYERGLMFGCLYFDNILEKNEKQDLPVDILLLPRFRLKS